MDKFNFSTIVSCGELVNSGGKPVNNYGFGGNKPWEINIRHQIASYMPVAGYSGTPLLKKLGIKDGWKVRLIGAPADYFDLLKADLSKQICPSKEAPDFIHLFAATLKDFEKEMPAV